MKNIIHAREYYMEYTKPFSITEAQAMAHRAQEHPYVVNKIIEKINKQIKKDAHRGYRKTEYFLGAVEFDYKDEIIKIYKDAGYGVDTYTSHTPYGTLIIVSWW